jgi:hypothetical protein
MACGAWIDYDFVRICLRTAVTNGSIVHPTGDMRAWRSMVIMMLAGNNFWLVHQSSLTVLPTDTSGASRGNGQRGENFAYQYPKYLKGFLTCRKILRHGTSSFTSHPKEGVLRIYIAIKNPPPRLGLNPRPSGPMASTLFTTPSRPLVWWKLVCLHNWHFYFSVYFYCLFLLAVLFRFVSPY